MLKGHGDDTYSYKKEIKNNFSSNIYGKQNLSALHKHLASRMELIHSYPEPDADSLANLLADKYNIPSDSVCVTNGATEAIYLIAQTYSGFRTGIIIPTFSEYEDACLIHKHTLSFYKKTDEIQPGDQLVWICNPNNPNGQIYDIDSLIQLVEKHKDTIFVFDQSYGYFTEKPVWNIQDATKYKNVILLHSMTKQYAVPGLRLGYLTAHPDRIREIEMNRMPWSVNGLAVEAGKFLLKNEIDLPDIPSCREETKRLQTKLSEIRGLLVYPTFTHYFLCQLENKKASDLKLWLIDHFGVLIRDASNFRGLDEHYFRIATQSPEENDLLVKALKEWI